jgi:hypothetical protein
MQQGAIGQAGQAVMMGDVPDALLGLHALEHFLLQLRIGAGQFGGALDDALLEFLVGAQQGFLGLVALGDILENPCQVQTAGLAGDTPPGGPHPECGAVLLPRPRFADVRLAGHEHRMHFGAVALIVGFAEVEDACRSPGQFLRPVAENFGQLAIAALHHAVPREEDADRRIVENQSAVRRRPAAPAPRPHAWP